MIYGRTIRGMTSHFVSISTVSLYVSPIASSLANPLFCSYLNSVTISNVPNDPAFPSDPIPLTLIFFDLLQKLVLQLWYQGKRSIGLQFTDKFVLAASSETDARFPFMKATDRNWMDTMVYSLDSVLERYVLYCIRVLVVLLTAALLVVVADCCCYEFGEFEEG